MLFPLCFGLGSAVGLKFAYHFCLLKHYVCYFVNQTTE